MNVNATAIRKEPETRNPLWLVAATLVGPLAVWLLITKLWESGCTAATLFGAGPSKLELIAVTKWLFTGFKWPRLAVPLCAGLLAWRVAPRFRLPAAILASSATLLLLLLLALKLNTMPGNGAVHFLRSWFQGSFVELNIFVSMLWREALTAAGLFLAALLILRICPKRFQRYLIVLCQITVCTLCLLLGVHLAYLVATGQPFTISLLVFSLEKPMDFVPLIQAELTAWRIAMLLMGPIGAASFYFICRRNLRNIENTLDQRWATYLPVTAAIVLIGFASPVMPAGKATYERYSEGTLVGLTRSLLFDPSRKITRDIEAEFARTGQPRWQSAHMEFQATDKTTRRNIVIIMLECFRADSTSMHSRRFDVTPTLATLAKQGMLIEDMSVVEPRTSAAWMAILGGIYPPTNEGTKVWSEHNKNASNIRGLPAVLRNHGYSSALFSTSHLGVYNELDIARALGFREIYGGDHFAKQGRPQANYMGYPDDMLVAPVLDWAAKHDQTDTPFLLTIMSNVGHHTYETPETWRMVKHDNVTDPAYNSYLNCLGYMDGVIHDILDGFKRLGLEKETIFVIVGDHGTPFAEHGYRLMNGLYQESVHVPALIYAPGLIQPGTRVSGPRQQIDFLPTLADLLGYQIRDAVIPGRSLLSPPDPTRKVFLTGVVEQTSLALRQGNLKYLYDFGRSKTLVFDLDQDPDEKKPLANVDASALSAVEQSLLDWQISAKHSVSLRPSDSSKNSKWIKQ